MTTKKKGFAWRDIARRALKTAGQTFMSLVSLNAVLTDFNPNLLETAACAAGGAAAAVLWNAVQNWLDSL